MKKRYNFKMKKMLLSIVVITILINTYSCGNDDAPLPPPVVPPLVLQLPQTIESEFPGSAFNSTLTLSYNDENQLESIDIDDGFSTSQVTIAYNSDGLISRITEEETDPSPFSVAIEFDYTDDVVTELRTIIDGGIPNVFNPTFDETDNRYTFIDGGEQIFTFDAIGNFRSYSASGIAILTIVANASDGLFNDLRPQPAFGLSFPILDENIFSALYFLSTTTIEEIVREGLPTLSVNTIRDADDNITGVEFSDMSGVVQRVTVTSYKTVEL